MMRIATTSLVLLVVCVSVQSQQQYSYAGLAGRQQVTTLQSLLGSNGLANNGQAVTLLLINPQQMIRGNFGSGLAEGIQQRQQEEVNYVAPATPVRVNYQSRSAPLEVQHTHIPAPKPELKLSRSDEEPHVLIHEIFRPVVQEIREIITPYRRIVQEIRPVQESVVQNIHKRTHSTAGAVGVKPARLSQPGQN